MYLKKKRYIVHLKYTFMTFFWSVMNMQIELEKFALGFRLGRFILIIMFR